MFKCHCGKSQYVKIIFHCIKASVCNSLVDQLLLLSALHYFISFPACSPDGDQSGVKPLAANNWSLEAAVKDPSAGCGGAAGIPN